MAYPGMDYQKTHATGRCSMTLRPASPSTTRAFGQIRSAFRLVQVRVPKIVVGAVEEVGGCRISSAQRLPTASDSRGVPFGSGLSPVAGDGHIFANLLRIRYQIASTNDRAS